MYQEEVNAAQAAAVASQADGSDPIVACLVFLAQHYDRPSSPVLLTHGLAVDEDGRLPFHQVERAAEHVGLRALPERMPLRKLRGSRLPAVLQLSGGEAAVALEEQGEDLLVYTLRSGKPVWVSRKRLDTVYLGEAVLIEPDPTRDREGERPWEKAARTHWFWSEVYKVRKVLFHVGLAAAVINLLALALPLFTMNVYDRIIPNKSVASLWVLAVGVLLALTLDFALRIARAKVVDEAGRALDARLSQKLFEKVINLPLSQRQGSTGAFAKRVSEYETVRDFFTSTTVVLVVDLLFLFIFLGVIALLAGWLVMVPIVGIGLMFLAGRALQRAMAQVSIDAQADSSLQHSVLVEAIGGQETLKAVRAEGRMLGRWRRHSETSAVTQEKFRSLGAISVNLATLCQQLMNVGLVVGGFYLFNAGVISMGAIIAVVMLSSRAMAPIGQLAFLMTKGRQALQTMNSLQTLTEAPDERSIGARSVIPEIAAGEIKMEHVTFRYPNASGDSLADVSLSIKPGERIGVIGRVASGKSTLGRVLCGLYEPTGGSYLIDSLDSRQHHPQQVRGAFRYVGQDAELFSGTVRDNLTLGAVVPDDARLIEAVHRSGAHIFLARDAAGFDLSVGERGSRLSGGQRSFLVLARALVEPCKLLYLDEPTGAMDQQTESWFIDHLAKAISPDQTLIVSTHRNAMLAIVDRLIVIDQGRIIADGPKESVISALSQLPQPEAQTNG